MSTIGLPYEFEAVVQDVSDKISQGINLYQAPNVPTKKEHLVPQFMIKSFVTEAPFYAFIPKSDKIIEQTTTQDVCCKTNEYEMFDENHEIIYRNIIEHDFLSKTEGLLAPFYRNFLYTARLSNNVATLLQQDCNRYALVLLMLMLTLRSPRNWPKYAKLLEYLAISPLDTDRNTSLLGFAETMPMFADLAVTTFNFLILRTPPNTPFILSSRPSFVQITKNVPRARQSQIWTCPIAPDILVLMTNNEVHPWTDGSVVNIDKHHVDRLNQLLLQDQQTEQFVSTDKALLQKYQQKFKQIAKPSTIIQESPRLKKIYL